ncbi:hypothetical protein [Alicyclobacillus vulcanalis]|uniref:Uncharacterized protein n=1 Tax=Alicyclobacillus vulcanalis TaxID=252246 RepID=A0A1N7MY73_9BACL|nr:hypothetical protein [Alicyclobacillus vulcanalis]SIS91035.1 hypothetical protein SAMN05421799_106213 [Alicyclobacillus vulcanalis]
MDPSVHPVSPSHLAPTARGVERTPPIGTERAEHGATRPTSQGTSATLEREAALGSSLDALEEIPYEILRDDALWASERAWRTALQGLLFEMEGQTSGATFSPREMPSVPHGSRNVADQPGQNGSVANDPASSEVQDAGLRAQVSGVHTPPWRPVSNLSDGIGQQDAVEGEGASALLVSTVRHLWAAMRELVQQGEAQSTVRLREAPTSPIIPFASMGHAWTQHGLSSADQARLAHWILLDRLLASVAPHPFDRRGGGVFVPNGEQQTGHPIAIRWRAERRTRLGPRGKLVHRLRLDLQLEGRPLTCVLTAQRPALHVHITCPPGAPYVGYLEKAPERIAAPLQACGWELTSWTVAHEEEDPNAAP